MRKVGIHLADELVTPLKGPFKTLDIGGSQSQFPLSFKQVEPAVE
jgi:hypothetical protein